MAHGEGLSLSTDEQLVPRETSTFYILEETINFWTFLLLLGSIISHFLVLTSLMYSLVSGSNLVQPATVEAELEPSPGFSHG